MRYSLCACLAAFTLAPYGLIAAAQSQSADARVYTPEDFAKFAPRTARDMVERVPGFRLPGNGGGNNNERGFGEADDNVLINGQRPSSKSRSINGLLNQIPATNVVRIELLDGASLDIPGLSGLVVNVVAETSGFGGFWEYRARIYEDVQPYFDGFQISLSGEQGNVSWSAGFDSRPERDAASGREDRFDPLGVPIEVRDEASNTVGDRLFTTFTLAWDRTNGHTANLNAKVDVEDPEEREVSDQFNPSGDLLSQTLFQASEEVLEAELGADYALDVGPGRLKLIGLQRIIETPSLEQSRENNTSGEVEEVSVFDQTVDETESILRTEYAWTTGAGHDWQVSLEGAFNTLEATSALFEQVGTGPLVPVVLSDPFVEVEETRAEAFITHGRALTEAIQVQLSVGAEISEISTSGTAEQNRQFTRPKGSLSLSWKAREDLTINTRLERSVGQLDFFDFVSSVDLNLGDSQAGNVDIVPDQKWRAELEFEKDFGAWGASTLLLFAEDLEDIIDQVPIGQDEGPGNLDQATRIGAELEGTLILDPIGWTGAQLTYSAEIEDSEVDDPLTGQARRINGDTISNIEVELRHDITDTSWAWGLEFSQEEEAKIFRLDSVRQNLDRPGELRAFLEHKDLFGLTARLSLRNILDSENTLDRERFEPDRTGSLSRLENRSRTSGLALNFNLQGSF